MSNKKIFYNSRTFGGPLQHPSRIELRRSGVSVLFVVSRTPSPRTSPWSRGLSSRATVAPMPLEKLPQGLTQRRRCLLLGTRTSKECCRSVTSHFQVFTVTVGLRSVFHKFILLDRKLHFRNILFLSGVLLLFRLDHNFVHFSCVWLTLEHSRVNTRFVVRLVPSSFQSRASLGT